MKKLIAVFTSLVLVVGLMPLPAFAKTGDEAAGGGLVAATSSDLAMSPTSTVTLEAGSKVWFGGKPWRVLNPNATANDNTGQKGILLLSEYVLENRLWDDAAYSSSLSPNDAWNNSDIRAYLRGDFETKALGMTQTEKGAVITAVKSDRDEAHGNNECGVGLSGDRFFLLNELEACQDGYLAENAARVGERFSDLETTTWMLRSAYYGESWIVRKNGESTRNLYSNTEPNGVRPAFYLNPNSISGVQTDEYGIQRITFTDGTTSQGQMVTVPTQNDGSGRYTMSAVRSAVIPGQDATVIVTPATGYSIENITPYYLNGDTEVALTAHLSSNGANVTATFSMPSANRQVQYQVAVYTQTINTPGTVGLNVDVNGENMPIIWMGTRQNRPWLVIGYDGAGNYYAARKGVMTLLSQNIIGTTRFQSHQSSDYYESLLRTYTTFGTIITSEGLPSGLINPFSTVENSAIQSRALSSYGSYYLNSTNTKKWHYGESDYDPTKTISYAGDVSDKFWALSAAEADALPDNGAQTYQAYWLRSPGRYRTDNEFDFRAATADGSDVSYTGTRVMDELGARFAFDMSTSSIVMSSAAEGGKLSGETGPNSLTEWAANPGREWKLTMKDPNGHGSFAINADATVQCETGQMIVTYSGAATGKNEYISAMIRDSSGTTKYYGRLKNCAESGDAAGTVGVSVTSDMLKTGDTLYLFNEQCNGDKKTDYVSDLIPVSIPTTTIGHEWGQPTYVLASDGKTVTASRACSHCSGHIESETANVTLTTNDAGTWYCSATFTNPAFGTWSKTITHEWEEPIYEWSDDFSTVTATRTCEHDPAHVETETANSQVDSLEGSPSWKQGGNYTRSAAFENKAFQRQTTTASMLPTVWYADRAWLNISDDATPSNVAALLSDDAFGEIYFEGTPGYTDNREKVYSSSLLGQYLDTYLYGGERAMFTEKQQAAILPRTMEYVYDVYGMKNNWNNVFTESDYGNTVEALLWPLPTSEALKLPQHYLARGKEWWLYAKDRDRTDHVLANGEVFTGTGTQPREVKAVRPAFYLNQDAVLFASPAENGKPSGTLGSDAVTDCSANSTEWKLTMLDDGTVSGMDGHAGFAVDSVTFNNAIYTVTYHGATTGENEYISALVKDENGNVVKYGRIKSCANASDVSGTVTVRYEPGQSLFLFNEQYNGDKKTDYASALVDLDKLGTSICTLHHYVNGVCDRCGATTDLAEVAYWDPADETVKTCNDYSPIVADIHILNTGTYVVTENVDVDQRLMVRGDVNLILMDDKVLNAYAGIDVPKGSSLTIWGQGATFNAGKNSQNETVATHGTGSLHAYVGNNNEAAAIGSGKNEIAGDITIHGGRVSAAGCADTSHTDNGIGGAAIGCGSHGVCGRITIDDGSITADGYGGAAGIGGGRYSNGADVTISGGYVDVESHGVYDGMAAAAIGSGCPRAGVTGQLSAGTVSISGGVVHARVNVSSEVADTSTLAQAIGVNLVDAANNENSTLTLATGLRVAGEGKTIVAYDNRMATCRSLEAYVEPCTSHSIPDNDVDCIYCGAAAGRTVSFDAGGGIGSIDSVYVRSGDTYTMPNFNGFIPPTGVQYAAWRDQNGVIRFPGDKMKIADENMVLTAVWAETHDGITFYSWVKTDDLPDAPGNYFLVNHVSMSTTEGYITHSHVWVVPQGTVNLCLNGQTVESRYHLIEVNSGCTLNIYDHEGGRLPAEGYIICVSGGTLNLYGGTIDGSSDNSSVGIEMERNGTCNIYGGTITGCNGGGIYVHDAGSKLHIYNVTMTANGDNTNQYSRSAIENRGTTIIDDGAFTDNKSFGSYGGVITNSGTLTITGGTFKNNKAAGANGGIYNKGTLSISGNPIIENNTDQTGASNIWLPEGKTIAVGQLDEGAHIGVTMEAAPGVFAKPAKGYALKTTDLLKFFSDSDDYVVTRDDNGDGALTAASSVFTVTFVDEDGSVLKGAVEYKYGTQAASIAKPSDPTKEANAQYAYTFAGWTPEITPVIGNATYWATYNSGTNKHAVTFVDDDGAPFGNTAEFENAKEYDYGTAAADIVKPNVETKRDAQYTYVFDSWDPAVSDVTGAVTYKAKYNKTVNKYAVTFVDEDGAPFGNTAEFENAKEYDYGTAAADIVKPTGMTKASSEQCDYTFDGWDPVVTDVTGTATYRATYSDSPREYTITWKDDDGSVIDTTQVAYGQTPTHADAAKRTTAQYTYTFAGWTPSIAPVSGNATYQATYSFTVNKYAVKFVNDDGTELQSGDVAYGETPAYNGKTPVKADDAQYSYTFKGWNPEIAPVTGEATYKATYSKKEKEQGSENGNGGENGNVNGADNGNGTEGGNGNGNENGKGNEEKATYEVTSGSGAIWAKGSSWVVALTFKRSINDETTLGHFSGIEVDGKTVPDKDASGNENWKTKKGSLVLSLQPTFLETLSEGGHTVKVVFDDGSAEATFEVMSFEDAVEVTLPDLDPNSWYMGGDGTRGGYFPGTDTLYLDYTLLHGLMSGYVENGKVSGFGPNDRLKRAEAVTVFYRMANEDYSATTDPSKYEANRSGLPDVEDYAYYTAAVNWGVENGVITGYTDEAGNPYAFGPDDPLLREQIATINWRWCTSEKGGGMDQPTKQASELFDDAAYISGYALKGVAFCCENGIMTGIGGTRNFSPQGYTERCEMAKIIAVTDKLVKEKRGQTV